MLQASICYGLPACYALLGNRSCDFLTESDATHYEVRRVTTKTEIQLWLSVL